MSGQVKVNDFEIVDHDLYLGLSEEQVILTILKDKGAPVLGDTLLSLDPDYDYSMIRDDSSHSNEFIWDKMNKTLN